MCGPALCDRRVPHATFGDCACGGVRRPLKTTNRPSLKVHHTVDLLCPQGYLSCMIKIRFRPAKALQGAEHKREGSCVLSNGQKSMLPRAAIKRVQLVESSSEPLSAAVASTARRLSLSLSLFVSLSVCLSLERAAAATFALPLRCSRVGVASEPPFPTHATHRLSR